MTDLIFCQKLKKDLPRLSTPPYPGELGKRIYDHISQDAWQAWLGHQTMLINEYRLNLMDGEARQFLAKEMEKFLFEEGAEKPQGFVEPEEK